MKLTPVLPYLFLVFTAQTALSAADVDEQAVRRFLQDKLELSRDLPYDRYEPGDCSDESEKKPPFPIRCDMYRIARINTGKPKKILDPKTYPGLMPSAVSIGGAEYQDVDFEHSYVYYLKDRKLLVSFVSYTAGALPMTRVPLYKELKYKAFVQ